MITFFLVVSIFLNIFLAWENHKLLKTMDEQIEVMTEAKNILAEARRHIPLAPHSIPPPPPAQRE